MGTSQIFVDVAHQQQIPVCTEGRIKRSIENMWSGIKDAPKLGEHSKGRAKRHPALRGLEPFAVVRGSGREFDKHRKIKKLVPRILAESEQAHETQATQGVGRVVCMFTNIQPSFYPSPVIA